MKSVHGALIKSTEAKGTKSAMARVENVAKRGTRILCSKMFNKHIRCLKPILNSRKKLTETVMVIKRLLAEALVLVGEADQLVPSRYQLLKSSYDQLLV